MKYTLFMNGSTVVGEGNTPKECVKSFMEQGFPGSWLRKEDGIWVYFDRSNSLWEPGPKNLPYKSFWGLLQYLCRNHRLTLERTK